MLQLLNLHSWRASRCTLPTAQCTLRKAPAPANAPEYEHVHITQHVKHCTLDTTCLYCTLKLYHFTLQT